MNMKNRLRSVNGSDKLQTTQLWQRFILSVHQCVGTPTICPNWLVRLASRQMEHVISVEQRTACDQTDPALMQ